MKPKRPWLFLSLSLTAALVLGCTGEPAGPPTAVVTGIVTLDGAPVADALINFEPVGEASKHAQAYTDQQGQFDVSIYVDNNQTKRGMVPGQYRVTIRKMETPAGGSTLVAPKNLLPAQYASPETSGLEVTIKPEEANELTLAMTL